MSRTAPLARSASRSRLLALAVLSASSLMFILDGSIVTVAMPAIQRDLDFTPGGLTWVINGYLLAFGGLLLLAGRLGDLLGRKRMFLAGIGVFTLASLVAGLATSPATLIAARVLQGAGSALAAAVGLGILVTLFTEPRDRARAIGVFAFTGAAGASLGQVLGGLLTDLLSWHWIFLINLPIGIAAALLAVPALPADRGLGIAAGSDVPGALLVTTGLMTGIYTLVKVEEYGWTSAHTLGLGAVAAVLLAGFFVRQATARTPLMPLRILRSRNVAGGNLVQILTLAGMFAFQVLVALYMQQVLGYSALETGLAMLPAAVGIGGVSLGVSARLIGRFGERAVLLAGLALLTAALLLLTRLPADAAYVPHLLPTMVLITGGGLVLPALSAIGMSGARPDDAGLVSGLLNTTQQIGPAIGVAALSTLAGSRTATALATGASRPEALTAGYTLAFGLGAALLATAFVATLLILRPPTPNIYREGFWRNKRRSRVQNPSL